MATTEELLQQIDEFRPKGKEDTIPLSVTEQRNIAFELLGRYFDLHRHDSRAKDLQSQTERLLWWSTNSHPIL